MSAYETKLLLVRLVTNEELVANTTVTPNGVTMNNITIIVPTQAGSIQLAPYLPYADKDESITIAADKVLFTVKPHEKLAEEHKRIYSEILMPEEKKIIV